MHLVLVFLGWLVGFQAVSVYAGPSRITFIISAAFPEATRQGLHPFLVLVLYVQTCMGHCS